MKHKHKTQ